MKTQYHLLQRNNSFIVVRTPDYKSSGWRDTICIQLFNHNFDTAPGHYDSYRNAGLPITEANHSTATHVLGTIDKLPRNIDELCDEYPEWFI